MSAQTILFKRGDTFIKQLTASLDDDPAHPVPQDLTGWSVQSQVRDKAGNLLGECEIVYVDRPNGVFQVIIEPAVTRGWPVNKTLYWDVQYTTDVGQVVSTATVEIDCQLDITLPTP